MSFHVRTAKLEDAEGIGDVQFRTWHTAYRGIMPDTLLDEIRVEDYIQRKKDQLINPTGVWFVAESAGEIVGFSCGGDTREDEISDFDGELYAMYVQQESQGLGVGRALFKAVAEVLAAEGRNSIAVWTLEDNPSKRFYEKLGGRQVAMKPETYGGEILIKVAYGWDNINDLLI